jgi:hypothetical protein
MLRLDLVERATDVPGDIDPCLFGRGPGFSTPATQTQGALQYALDLIDLVFDPGDTLLILELAGFFEFLSQFDSPLFKGSYSLGVEKVTTVPAQAGVDGQLG